MVAAYHTMNQNQINVREVQIETTLLHVPKIRLKTHVVCMVYMVEIEIETRMDNDIVVYTCHHMKGLGLLLRLVFFLLSLRIF